MEFKLKQNQYDLDFLIKNANIFYGHGGSQNAIFVYKNTVAKLIPNFEKEFNEAKKYKKDQEEIRFYKEFTKHLILKNKTPHIVGYYDNKKINMYEFIDKHINKCNIKKKTIWEHLYFDEKNNINPSYMKYEDYIKSTNKDIKPGVLESIFTFIKNIVPNTKTKKTDTQVKYSTYISKKYTEQTNTYKTKKVKRVSKEKQNIDSIICNNYEKINNYYINSRFIPNVLEKEFDICYVEYCPTSIDIEFDKLLKSSNDIDKIQASVSTFLHRVVFQFMFTMCAIYEKYPSFVHNDCFLRNILAVNETHYKSNDYIEYIIIRKNGTTTISTKNYYLPANGICIKINDFGYSFAMPELGDKVSFEKKKYYERFITDKKEIPFFTSTNKHKGDIWNFLFDLYNGSNRGASSCIYNIKLSNLSAGDKLKLNHTVKTTLHNYINTDIVDKLKKKKYDYRFHIDGIWNIINIPELHQTIQYPENYFINDFNFKEFQSTSVFNDDKKDKGNVMPKRNIIKTFTVCIN